MKAVREYGNNIYSTARTVFSSMTVTYLSIDVK